MLFKVRTRTLVFLILLLCWQSILRADAELYQYSTIEALLGSVFVGELTVEEMLDEGDFGIGTFNHLDGELLVFDGIVYQIKGDGTVHRPGPKAKVPYASMCEFDEDDAVTLKDIPAGLDYVQLQSYIDKALPSLNLFYAIKVEGSFQTLKARSVHAQEEPYPPLAEIVKSQSVFDFEQVEGTLVGFRCPQYAGGINVPGYHFHFLNKAKDAGGHVLGLATGEITVQVLTLDEWDIQLPMTDAFMQKSLGADVSEELKSVETLRR